MRRALIWGAGVLVVLGVAALFALWWTLLRDLPDVETLADYRPPLTSTVLDRNGVPIGEFFEERRRLVELDEMPDYVVQAFLAAEDDTFYQHRGVDYVSIMRAAWAVVMAGGSKVQGGSTITQQLVKQMLLSPEQTYTRKIRELYLAQQVEERFDKQEILFLYLNHIYFGSGAHGIGEAARTYFGKQVSELEVGEAALLGGLPKKPGANSPFLDPVAAEERRHYVLGRMLEEGFIDAAQHEAGLAPLELADPDADPFAASGYVVEEVRRRLVEILGNEIVLGGGLTIETTLDLDAQIAAVQAVQRGVEALDRRRGYRGPLREVDPGALGAERAFLDEQNRITGGELPLDFFDAPREGVVISVDKNTATVAFGSTTEATVILEDAAWAHDAEDESKHGEEVKLLTEVFSPGDVARFRVLPAENDDESALRAVLYQLPDAQGALISIDLATSEVVAMVGGYDFAESEFNRTIQAHRQPGSAFKPIVYAAAVAHGYTPASILHDRPVVYTDESSGFVFKPENYGRRFLGALTMTEALARSVNNAAIHLLRDVGIDRVMRFTETLGVRSPMERVLGLALGGSPVTLLELTRAYGVLGSGGRYVEPRLVARVMDRDGRVILENVALDPLAPVPEPNFPDEVKDAIETAREEPEEEEPEPEPAPEPVPARDMDEEDEYAGLDLEPDAPRDLPGPRKAPAGHVMHPSEAYLAASMLRAVVEHPNGTGRRALRLGRPVAGKTGTTNDNTDAWFVGFSPEVATGVWVGIDEKQVLGRRETGGRAAAPIWVDFMEAALAERPVRDFEIPDDIVFARVDAKTGKLASPASVDTLFQAFIAGTEPTERSDPTTASDPGGRLRLDF